MEVSSAYSSCVRRTNPGGGSRRGAGVGWSDFPASSFLFGGLFGGSFSPSGLGVCVELYRLERRAATGVVWGKRAARTAGLGNGLKPSLEQRASWRVEVRNMVARWLLGGAGGGEYREAVVRRGGVRACVRKAEAGKLTSRDLIMRVPLEFTPPTYKNLSFCSLLFCRPPSLPGAPYPTTTRPGDRLPPPLIVKVDRSVWCAPSFSFSCSQRPSRKIPGDKWVTPLHAA